MRYFVSVDSYYISSGKIGGLKSEMPCQNLRARIVRLMTRRPNKPDENQPALILWLFGLQFRTNDAVGAHASIEQGSKLRIITRIRSHFSVRAKRDLYHLPKAEWVSISMPRQVVQFVA